MSTPAHHTIDPSSLIPTPIVSRAGHTYRPLARRTEPGDYNMGNPLRRHQGSFIHSLSYFILHSPSLPAAQATLTTLERHEYPPDP